MKRRASPSTSYRCWALIGLLVFLASDANSEPAQVLCASTCLLLLLPSLPFAQVRLRVFRVREGISRGFDWFRFWCQVLRARLPLFNISASSFSIDSRPWLAINLISGGMQTDFERLFIPIRLNGVAFTAMLDSGAETCAISQNLLEKIPSWDELPTEGSAFRLLGANQQEILQKDPPVTLEMQIGSQRRPHSFCTLQHSDELLLGICCIRQFGLNVVRKKDQGEYFVFSIVNYCNFICPV